MGNKNKYQMCLLFVSKSKCPTHMIDGLDNKKWKRNGVCLWSQHCLKVADIIIVFELTSCLFSNVPYVGCLKMH